MKTVLIALAGLTVGYFLAGIMPPPCWARPPFECPVKETPQPIK